MANFTIISDNGKDGIATMSVNNKENGLNLVHSQVENIKKLFGGNTGIDENGNVSVTGTSDGINRRWRIVPTADIISSPVDNDCISKDAFMAKIMLTDGIDSKLDVIACKDVDKMPEEEWESVLLTLSVYLNMSVCDILGEIEARRQSDDDIDEQAICYNMPDPEDYDYGPEYTDEYCTPPSYDPAY